MKKKPTNESITSMKSRSKLSLMFNRKERSLTNKMTAKTRKNP
jgi:hypothetical protein